MKISVLGCGRWGSFIGWYLDKIGHDVTLYGRAGGSIEELIKTRSNELLQLPESIKLTDDLADAIKSDTIIVSVPSQSLRAFLTDIAARFDVKDKTFVLCMKGLEQETGKRLTEIAAETLGADVRTAIWVGPGHVQDFIAGIPNCMVIDSAREEVKNLLVPQFQSELIRFYYGTDLIGNEIGAAAKNVVGIAAGMLDGMDRGALKGALMSRGTREIARLIKALGGNEITAYGLSHLGDYEATVFSKHSHNRSFGELYARGQAYGKLAEGVFTVKALLKLSQKTGVELPICEAVYSVLYGGVPLEKAITDLFLRSLKSEF